jgi:hypothetical protein
MGYMDKSSKLTERAGIVIRISFSLGIRTILTEGKQCAADTPLYIEILFLTNGLQKSW